jgi:hypothetical protein
MALEGGEESASRFRRSLPPGKPGTLCTGDWVGPRAGLDRCGKSRPPSGFDPRTAQPVASCYTDWDTSPTVCECSFFIFYSFCFYFIFFCFNTVSPSSVFFSLLYDLFIDSDYMVLVFRSINVWYTGGARGGAVGWGTALQTEVVGSIPDGIIWIFHWYNSSVRTMALG